MTEHDTETPGGSDHRGGDHRTVAQVKAGLLEWSRTRDIRTNKAWAQAGWYAAGGVGVLAVGWLASRVLRGAAPARPATGLTARPSLLQSAARQAGRASLLWRMGGWVFSKHQERKGAAGAAGSPPTPVSRTPMTGLRPALRSGNLPFAQGRIT